jgi:hypothetical protein
MFWFIGFLALMIVGCYCTYKTAEVQELHKVRAAFDLKEHKIEELIKEHTDEKDFNKIFYEGEIEELEELKTEIDKRIKELKSFDIIWNDDNQ